MKPALLGLTAALSLATAALAHAAGSVQLTFVEPDKFTDVRDGSFRGERNLEALKQVMTDVAAAHVADGQTLELHVLDVDLAGEVRPGGRLHDVRVLRGGADWPRITLRWRLEGGSQAGRGGLAVVQDMTYLQRSPPPSAAAATLAYERRMLEDWFRQEFRAPAVN